jgi:hypothetical protein
VEEAQREKAKYRKERGIEWVPKVSVKVKQNSFTFANNVVVSLQHFKLLEDGRWVYENTLERRNPDLKK